MTVASGSHKGLAGKNSTGYATGGLHVACGAEIWPPADAPHYESAEYVRLTSVLVIVRLLCVEGRRDQRKTEFPI